MAYRVEIARNAEAGLEELYLWVMALGPQQGAKWFNGLDPATKHRAGVAAPFHHFHMARLSMTNAALSALGDAVARDRYRARTSRRSRSARWRRVYRIRR